MAQDTPTCVVTGGTRGIGKAIALRMSADGYKTLLTYKSDESSAIETTQEIRNLGSECVCVKANLTRPESVDTVVETALSTWGKIDVLVNNAAISSNENLIADTDPEDWKEMINVNLNSVFDITRKVIPIMRRRGGGNIVNLSSNITKRLAPTFGAYAVSKAGLEALTIILATTTTTI